MRPIQLTIQAFGSYGQRAVIDFTKPTQNLFLVTGDTGAGKTTIFDAIVYALYGDKSEKNTNKNAVIPNLQSQFAPLDVTPFVELTFAETVGGQERIYVVHRIPHHWRKAKRGNSEVEEKESVTLTLPDHTDYLGNKDAVNQKLGEIVGLTKEQFMQVGMIAQGDFMRILRAPTSEKREIFRRLFNTEIFDKIVSRLGERNSQYQSELQNILRICQAKSEEIVVPEDFVEKAGMEELLQKIRKDKLPGIVDFETLQVYLDNVCEMLAQAVEKANSEMEMAQKAYDAGSIAVTRAESLEKSFEQLAAAREKLQGYAGKAEAMAAKEKLAKEIRAAFLIDAAHKAYERQQKDVTATEETCRKQEDILPELMKQAADAALAMEKAKSAQDQAEKIFGKVQAEVKAALVLFDEVAVKDQEIRQAEQEESRARQAAEQTRQAVAAYQQKVEKWQEQIKALPELLLKQGACEKQRQILQQYEAEVKSGIDLGKKMQSNQQGMEKAQSQFQEAKRIYRIRRERYDRENSIFLDAQAGILAESLVSGKPCPVCGATEHPHPRVLAENAKPLAREELEQLNAAVNAAEKAQQMAADVASGAKTQFDESKNRFEESLDNLRQKVPGCQVAETLNEIRQKVKELSLTCQTEWECLTGKIRELEAIRKQIDQSTEKCRTLQLDSERAAENWQIAKQTYVTAQKARQLLQDRQKYATRADAEMANVQVESERNKRALAYEKASETEKDLQEKLNRSKALLEKCQQELPEKRRLCQELQAAYSAALQEKGMRDDVWQNVVADYEEESAERMLKEVQEWRNAYHAAAGSVETAELAVEGKQQPDLAVLREKRDAAQAACRLAADRQAKINRQFERDQLARKQLAEQLNSRDMLGKEAIRISNLYERLSGKRSGARMDIETYVQRYYLRQILGTANRRFLKMNGGQFELRMLDDAEAARGSNHGLDLKVFHTVTGKERAIQTLSGGESFMAALSLALGLSHQIQANVASINLDVLFIDEGFGSLDDASRNDAVHVLQKMAGSDKLIGIISHVTELKQEIDNQLLVTKDDKGSHVTWQIS